MRPQPPGRRSPGCTSGCESEPVAALDVLRRRLGVPTLPRYSVLCVGLDGVDVDDLLGLLHYGIRVFWLTPSEPAHTMDADQLQAFEASRLLEIAVAPSAAGPAIWVVDGALPATPDDRMRQALSDADSSGQINFAQYRVVHAATDVDVVVEAGAGTGKTETMSERIVFLLATGSAAGAGAGGHPQDLRADEIALVTFTREAAAEMRARVEPLAAAPAAPVPPMCPAGARVAAPAGERRHRDHPLARPPDCGQQCRDAGART